MLPPEDGSARRFAIARLPRAWYIGCRSRDLGRQRPLACTVLDQPLVLFRSSGDAPTALLDRCAHRNLPLSIGRVVGNRPAAASARAESGERLLECAYHGWRYDGAGICRVVPALCGDAEGKARRVPRFTAVEQQGYVWVFATPDARPSNPPYLFPKLGAPGYASVHFRFDLDATLLSTLENILDVPHTATLHRGLFRAAERRNRVTAVVRRFADRAEAEYLGEPRPSGLVGRLLAPEGGTVEHVDRFLLPSIAQVEYRLGERSHLVVTNALTPISDFRTRLSSVVSLRLPLPAMLVRPLLEPLARRIFLQDAEILKRQTESTRRFDGEQYASTEVDLLGPHIWRLLRTAEAGAPPQDTATTAPEHERRVDLLT